MSAATGGPEQRTTRDRLLAAAVEVFANEGQEGSSVQTIARRAGLTTGAIYANFDSKAALLGEALAMETAHALVQLAGHGENGDGEVTLGQAMHRDLRVGRQLWAHELLVESWVAALRDDEARRILLDGFAQAQRVIEQRLERAGVGADQVSVARSVLFPLLLGTIVARTFDTEVADAGVLDEVVGLLTRLPAASG